MAASPSSSGGSAAVAVAPDPRPTPAGSAAPGSPLASAATATQAAGRGADTPTRMRVLAIATAVVAAAFGVASSAAMATRTNQMDGARVAAAQLERLETIRIAVVEADSLAASAYLAGGLEPPERRRDYETQLATAHEGLIAAAVGASAADSRALGSISAALDDAAGRVEQARANSRQGFPVGAAYQRSSSALIRSDVLPQLDHLADATGARVVSDVDSHPLTTAIVVIGALVALAVLLATSRWMFRRTNRVFNVGLVAAVVLVTAASVSAIASLLSATSSAVSTVEGPYAAATAYARARSAAFDARSNEALTLIARGNGSAYERSWVRLAETTSKYLARAKDADPNRAAAAADEFGGYTTAHQNVRALDDAGDHGAAVTSALALGDEGTPFTMFATTTRDGVTELAATTDASLEAAHNDLARQRWILLAGGLLAAAAAFAGITRRIQEYR